MRPLGPHLRWGGTIRAVQGVAQRASPWRRGNSFAPSRSNPAWGPRGRRSLSWGGQKKDALLGDSSDSDGGIYGGIEAGRGIAASFLRPLGPHLRWGGTIRAVQGVAQRASPWRRGNSFAPSLSNPAWGPRGRRSLSWGGQKKDALLGDGSDPDGGVYGGTEAGRGIAASFLRPLGPHLRWGGTIRAVQGVAQRASPWRRGNSFAPSLSNPAWGPRGRRSLSWGGQEKDALPGDSSDPDGGIYGGMEAGRGIAPQAFPAGSTRPGSQRSGNPQDRKSPGSDGKSLPGLSAAAGQTAMCGNPPVQRRRFIS